MKLRARLLALPLLLLAASCSQQDVFQSSIIPEAKVSEPTRATQLLRNLPTPAEPIPVAVYAFDDQTGQYKSNDRVTEYSSAVTRGGLALLNNALLEAGNKRWFQVIERGGLKNVIQERQVYRAMREEYRRPDGSQMPSLPPLYYANVLIEGGIVGYDTNTVTGGLAASYFGVGGNSQYRSDTVTVALRVVSTLNGQVLLSITSTKTIYSVQVQANVFKYLSVDRILQAESGFTLNEPVNLATRQAIETGVYAMVMEGALNGLWGFTDANAGRAAVSDYLSRKSADEGDVTQPTPAEAEIRKNLERIEEEKQRRAAAPQPQPQPQYRPQPQPQPQYRPEPAPALPQAEPLTPPPPVSAPVKPAEVPVPNVAPQPLTPEAAPEAKASEPLPPKELKPATSASPPSAQTPVVSHPGDPGAIVKYLNDSRYRTGNGKRGGTTCELDENGECRN